MMNTMTTAAHDLDGLTIVTASYKTYRPSMGYAVRTSVGRAHGFPHPHYFASGLAPYTVFKNPALPEREDRIDAYLTRLDGRIPQIVTQLLAAAVEADGQPLVLLCYEDVSHDPLGCHRRWAAPWLSNRFGLKITEVGTPIICVDVDVKEAPATLF